MADRSRLQVVLKHRRILEEQAQQRLAAALDRQTALLEELSRLRESCEALCSEAQARGSQGIAAHELLLYEEEIGRRRQRRGALEQDLQQAVEAVEEERQALCRATQDRKLLEKLLEKAAAQERRLGERREMAWIDELALRGSRREP